MTCSEYVERFSEVYDGVASGDVARAAHEHAESCHNCQRYRRVLERGADLLRALPPPDVREDFSPRLQHRLFDADHEDLLRRHTNSGAPALAVFGMAVVLVAVAWAPALRPSAPVVELAPIVVNRPPAQRSRSIASFSAFAVRPEPVPAAGLWGDARTLLFEYSRLSQRYGQRPTPNRSGLQEDR